MLITYDTKSQAIYIKIDHKGKVSKTVEPIPETFVDLDTHGRLIGVELLDPSSETLQLLAKQFRCKSLLQVDTEKIQEAVA